MLLLSEDFFKIFSWQVVITVFPTSIQRAQTLRAIVGTLKSKP